MKIGRKILILVAAFVAVILATSAINLYSFIMIQKDVAYTKDYWARGLRDASDIMNSFAHSRLYILQASDTWAQADISAASEYLGDTEKRLDAYAASANFTPQEKVVFDELMADFAAYKAMSEQALGTLTGGDRAADDDALDAYVMSEDFERAFDGISDILQDINAYDYQGVVDNSVEIDDYISNAIVLVLIISLVLGISIMVFAYMLSRSITKPIAQIVGVANSVAGGDISADVEIEAKAEIGTLASGLGNIVDGMNDSLWTVRKSSVDIVNVSNELKNSSGSVASAVTEQASSVQEIASTLASIATLSDGNKDGVRDCAELSTQMGDMATRGQSQIDEMLSAMDAIKTASVSISGVIKMISDIAFQTNILALNAAVEAARAGAHGKGFAVVAEEVRNLAQRSASSVKDTDALIKETVQKVERGLTIANDTESLLTKIIEGVLSMSEKMVSITGGVSEEAMAVQQIDQTVQQLAQTLQGNAASTQEISALAEQLTYTADDLDAAVKKFRLRDEGSDGNGGRGSGSGGGRGNSGSGNGGRGGRRLQADDRLLLE
ncbi:MAG: methyl-accepting chemotaxis protein [Clostridiales bacterium]|jgi:methyl-accepting chemotaxis protein|nr:methyl-accepting chemotaxis protein [Clostridiales bacterium]